MLRERWTLGVAALLLGTSMVANAAGESGLLRIETRKQSEGEPRIINVGVMGTEQDKLAHFDIANYTSTAGGDAWALDIGAAYLMPTQAPVYVGAGALFGYRREGGHYFGGYYPEAGAIIHITEGVSLTISRKRYFRLYDRIEDVLLFGVAFSPR